MPTTPKHARSRGRRGAATKLAVGRVCAALVLAGSTLGGPTLGGATALAQDKPMVQDKPIVQERPIARDKPGVQGEPSVPDKPVGRGTPAPEQSPAERTIGQRAKGPPGKDIRIAVYVNVKPDCSSGPMPTIRLVGKPAHGTVTVRKATIKATNVRDCLALEVPGFIAFYRSRPGFAGADSVALEVRFPDKPPRIHK
ncbi:hypothetical protein ABTU92_30360, partial [Rhodoplanes sp. SY1]